MTELLVGTACFSLLIVFCFRNFFVQLIGLKLLIDTLVLIIATFRADGQTPFITQTASFIVASVGILIFFVLIASGIQKFSQSESLNLEAEE